MKIAFIIGQFPALSLTFIINQITGLIDLGHEVDIYSRSTPPENKMHPDVEKYQLDDRTYYLDNVPQNNIKRILQALYLFVTNFHKSPITILNSLNIFRYGREALSLYWFYHVTTFLTKEYDILQCHFGAAGNFGAVLKEMGIRGKLVTMFHGIDIRSGIEMGGNIYLPLIKYGDCFLANSDFSHKNLINFGVDPQRIIFHPPGIDINKFIYKEESTVISIRHSPSIVILTVARLVEEKGLQYGIKAISKLLKKKSELSLEYHIIGSGPLEMHLKKLVEECGLTKNVHFLGSMVQEGVIREMNSADLFLLPSVSEAFGVVLLEAQAIGLPVIATSVGSVFQAIKDGESGFLVPERDVDALANRLIYLIENPELWPEMGKAGRKYVEEHYDIRKLNQRLVKIYEDLLSETFKYSSV